MNDVRLWLTTAFEVRLRAVDAKSGELLRVAPTWIVAPPAGFSPESRPVNMDEIDESRELLGRNAEHVVRGHAAPGDHALGDSIRLMARAIGYEPVMASLVLQTLQGTVHDVPFVPTHGLDSHGLIEVVPHFSESPFAGWLAISVSPVSTADSGGTSAFRLDFGSSGKAEIRLPEGRYMVRALGTGCQGAWWSAPSDAHEVDVAAGSRTILRLPLRGNPVRVRVRDASGRSRSGYDLQVSRPGKLGHWEGAWDLRVPNGAEGGPVVWVPPGEVTVAAWKGASGYGVASVSADGTGRPLGVVIEMKPGAEPRSADFVRRPR